LIDWVVTTQAASKFQKMREGTLNRFYTRAHVGDLILGQLGDLKVQRILDLGSGAGSLCCALAKHWPSAHLVTVDADPGCTDDLKRNVAEAGAKQHDHFVHDVFDPDLPKLLSNREAFDVAVCNPPFYRPAWRREFSKILSEADLADACSSRADGTAELVFLAQNLRLVRSGGLIAVIVPDSWATGWRNIALRRTLLERHRIESVLQLPSNAFRDTDARCFIFTLRKDAGPTQAVRLHRLEPTRQLSDPVLVSKSAAERRLDFDFHANGPTAGNVETVTLRSMGAIIDRGSLSTVQARSVEFPVFHTTDYGRACDGLLALGPSPITAHGRRLLVAGPGDILIARVDRRLHEKVGLVVSGHAALTDCIYRVRLPSAWQKNAFQALRSADGTSRLQSVSKGVSARLLGKADLLDLPLSTASV
jgi:type I restriction enzyme M protein